MNETKTLTVGKYKFEIVDAVPPGYRIWYIGKYMPPGYLPLCELKENSLQIIPDTLKAIKIDGAQKILDAVGWNTNTISEMEQYIKRHRNAKKGSRVYEHVQKVKAALPIMRQIRWE